MRVGRRGSDPVLCGGLQGQFGQDGVLGGADAVLAPGPLAVAKFQILDMSAAGVGDERCEVSPETSVKRS